MTEPGMMEQKDISRDERGATAVEYGLMVALIAATILGAITLLGQNMQAMYNMIAGTV